MTKLTKKQECIRKAYGTDWGKIPKEEQCNILERPSGMCDEEIFSVFTVYNKMPEKYEFIAMKKHFIRPKSLQGIESNNGWKSIEEHGLPTDKTIKYNIFNIDTKTSFALGYDWSELANGHKTNIITHYKPIEQPNLPLY